MLIFAPVECLQPHFCDEAFMYQELIANLALNPWLSSAYSTSRSHASLSQACVQLDFSQ